MKKLLVLTALCLVAFIGKADNYRDDGKTHYRCEAERTIDKTFDVRENPTLEMEGCYSNFIITTWDQPQIDFSIKITVKGDDGKKVEAKFKSIDVEFEQVGNKIIAKTVFGDYKYKSFSGVMTIKYYVKVPKDVAMDLQTKYGDITLDEANRKLTVDVKYGDFKANNISIDDIKNNAIEVKYGNINIENVNQIAMWLDYGNAKINTCDYIDGTLKYSKIFITDVNKGMLEIKYSDARIEKANKINFVNTAYSNMRVRDITEKLSVDMKYSDMSATVTALTPDIEIDGAYSDAVLYMNLDASFDYNLRSSYGDITFRGFFDKKSISSRGHYGDGEGGLLDISIKYGDVDIRKN